jgi:hypothetical protein
MAHHQVEVTEENYIFRSGAKAKIFMLLGLGVLLLAIGLAIAIAGEGNDGEHHGALKTSQELVASVDQHDAHEAAASEGGEHHAEGPKWLKRLKTTLWMNNSYFIGFGIIGLFFVAIQYAASAGWSAGVKRVAMAFGYWIPVVGIITFILFWIVKGDVFHWTHAGLFDETNLKEFDPLIDKKGPFFYWPLDGTSHLPVFFLLRMIIFFGVWYWFFTIIRRNMEGEDINGGTSYWSQTRVTSAWFLIFFAVSSSVAAWDWVMSIDTHWFSTMFGWYVFASWWVTGLAAITLVVAYLKDAGYLKVVNSNHLHDLGKFIFAFSIFWTYIWFSQYLLIWYANIPEETVYFIERLDNSPYSWIFYLNLILNFVLPFLLLMTRDAKRQISTLKLVCPIIIVGHWFDFYNMVTPGVMQQDGGIGFMEIGVALIYAAVLLFIVLTGLGRLPLFGKNDPMLQESLNHHI